MIYVIYFADLGTPKTGLSPTLDIFVKVSDGTSAGAPPAVSELSGGFYKFTYVPTEDVSIRVDSEDATMADRDRYISLVASPHDTGLDDIKGTGFVKDTDSLVDIRPETDKISTLLTESQSHPTLAEIEAGDMAAIKTETDKIPTLLTESQSHPTLAEIEAGLMASLALEATLATHDTDIKALLTTVQADLDNPNQYKADVSALALEATLDTHDTDIKALLATIQTDLDNPNQYKADVSALALEATLTAMKGAGWTTETLKVIKDAIDALNDLSAANVWAYATRTLTDKTGFALSAAGIQAIWDIAITNLTTAGSIGELMVLAAKILKNRWNIVGGQLIIYDNDGTTVLLRFNLSGAETTAYSQRTPV